MLKRNRTSVTDCTYHLVFVTKYRKSIFTDDTKRDAMTKILKLIATNTETEIENMEVMEDHVHMLISFAPKYSVSGIVKSFKGTSAREWFKQYPETKQLLWKGHLWSNSFFCSTVGNVSKNIVDQYIKDQMVSKLAKAKLGHAPTYQNTKKPR